MSILRFRAVPGGQTFPALLLLSFLIVAAALLQGCGNLMAAKDIPKSGRNLADSITKTTVEQLLAYIVSNRFVCTQELLAVTSINSQLSLQAGINGQAANGGAWSVTPSLQYQETPTITYTPVSGSQYVNQWLAPLSLQTMLVVMAGGWGVEDVLKITVQRLGPLENGYAGSPREYVHPPRFQGFYRAARLIEDLVHEGFCTISMLGDNRWPTREWALKASDGVPVHTAFGQVLPKEVGEKQYQECDSPMVFNFSKALLDPANPAHGAFVELLDLLDLDMGVLKAANNAYPNTLSVIAQNATFPAFATDIKIQTRSMQQIMYAMSWAVDVPKAIRKKGWTWTVPTEPGAEPFDFRLMFDNLLHVKTTDKLSRPEEASVSVKYLGDWYYIAQNDLHSKRTFIMLLQLSTLQSGIQNQATVPALTLGISK